MEQPLTPFMNAYNWLIRQQGQGVNTPNARQLAQIIRNLFKKDGHLAITDANTSLANEKGIKPSALPIARRADRDGLGEIRSERRAARLAAQAQALIPQPVLSKARLSRESRVAARGAVPLLRSEKKAVVALIIP